MLENICKTLIAGSIPADASEVSWASRPRYDLNTTTGESEAAVAKKTKAEQTAHELFLAQEFEDHLATVEHVIVEDLRPGDPAEGEPDAVRLVAGGPHGIELVDCWSSGYPRFQSSTSTLSSCRRRGRRTTNAQRSQMLREPHVRRMLARIERLARVRAMT